MGRLVSLVLVTWNSAPFLPRCLAGIAHQTWPDTELIAVDNASSDDSVARIRAAIPNAAIIENDTNGGFTRAVNQAIAVAKGELILLVNPDAHLTADYAQKLIEALDEAGENFGAATGTLISARGKEIEPTDLIDSKGIRMTRTGRHFDIDQGQPAPRAPRPAPPEEVFGVSGAAAMFRMSFVRDVSIDGEFLDEDFFTYREDADVAWRGRVFGWRALYVPDAIGYHVRTVTPERRRDLSPIVNMHSFKNRFLLRMKNESLYLALRHAPFELTRDLLTIGAVLTIERSSLPALGWLWRNRKRVWAKRRVIQKRRRVSDRELARWFR
jgi:GT2 family glycosyltransferase